VGGKVTAASVALWTLLAGPQRPTRVLEIEAGAVYLQVDPLRAADSRDGRDHPGAVVALLEPDGVQWPIGIVLPPAAADLVPVSVAGSPISRGEISIGWGAITLDKVRWPVLRWWNPGVPALELPPQSITAEPGTEYLDDPTRPDDATAMPEDLVSGLAALAAGDTEGAAGQLIGVGTGFIPPGDAVLVGALAALAAWAPEGSARQELAVAVAGAANRTTPVSAALLQSAVLGFGFPELARYITALSTGEPTVDSAFADLGTVGDGFGNNVALGVSRQLRTLRDGIAHRS
jgi:hypothetical protein